MKLQQKKVSKLGWELACNYLGNCEKYPDAITFNCLVLLVHNFLLEFMGLAVNSTHCWTGTIQNCTHCLDSAWLSRIVPIVWTLHDYPELYPLFGQCLTIQNCTHCLDSAWLSRIVPIVWTVHYYPELYPLLDSAWLSRIVPIVGQCMTIQNCTHCWRVTAQNWKRIKNLFLRY